MTDLLAALPCSKPGVLVSIVVPVFNEEINIQVFHVAVTQELAKLADRFEFEFVFTDNHSTDRRSRS